MPRVLQLLALLLAFVVSGAPTWLGEMLEDDCAEACADEQGCPDEGCGDCSIVCSSCPRGHVLVPSLATRIERGSTHIAWLACEALQRVPDEPVPDGVFHPPRALAA